MHMWDFKSTDLLYVLHHLSCYFLHFIKRLIWAYYIHKVNTQAIGSMNLNTSFLLFSSFYKILIWTYYISRGKFINRHTVKPLITDPPKSGQPPYNGQLTCPRFGSFTVHKVNTQAYYISRGEFINRYS